MEIESIDLIQKHILDFHFKSLEDNQLLHMDDAYKIHEKERFLNYLSQCKNKGTFEYLLTNETLDAAFLYDGENAKIICNSDHADSHEWLCSAIKNCTQLMTDEALISIAQENKKLIQYLCKNGFYIRFVYLFGNLNTAIEAFSKIPDSHEKLIENNISIETLKTEHELDHVMQIWEEEMTENPQFHNLGSIAKNVEELKIKIRKDLNEQPPKRFILKQDSNIVGYFGFDVWHDVPGYGTVAGSDLCFSKAIQNKGIVKAVYPLMFDAMKKHGTNYISGGTAQTPVMQLSKMMGRLPTRYALNSKKGYFAPEHFDIK